MNAQMQNKPIIANQPSSSEWIEKSLNVKTVEEAGHILAQTSDISDGELLTVLKSMRMNPLTRKYANEAFQGIADFFTDSSNKSLANIAASTIRKRDAADLKESLLIKHDGDLAGIQLTNSTGTQGAFFLPDASEPGRLRISFFDKKGFYGHATRDTYQDLLNEAWLRGFRSETTSMLEQLSANEKFTKGNEITSLIARVNEGSLTFEEYLTIAKSI